MNVEKYVAIIFEIIHLDKKFVLYKPVQVITDFDIDEVNDILLTSDGKSYICMDEKKAFNRNEKYCYGYATSLDELIDECTIELSEEEYIDNYFESIKEEIRIGLFNYKKQEVSILVAAKTELELLRDNNMEESFYVDSISVGEDAEIDITYSVSDTMVHQIINSINEKQYEKVEEYLSEIKNVVNFMDDGKDVMNKEIKESIQTTENKKNSDENKTLDICLNDLNNLVGLENIKYEVDRLVKNLIFRKKVEGIADLPPVRLHMVFTGNPGTGKTTVARILANILYNLGYVKNNKVAEITTKDLIAEYVGQTAIKTNQIIKKNKGGVIFIDEAYSFNSDAQAFGQEALVEILKEMENSDTAFIFAGYKDEMKNFLKMNSGLQSRIDYYIDYKNYREEELLQMFKNKVNKTKMKLDDNLDDDILNIIREASKNKYFENGRFIDKLFNKVVLEHAVNTENSKDLNELILITKKDIPFNLLNDIINDDNKEIGFNYIKRK